MINFVHAGTGLRVSTRTEAGPEESTEFTEGETIHVVRNLGTHDAIDLHFCGPRGAGGALRYNPREPESPFVIGQEFAVDVVEDRLPLVMPKTGSL